MSTPKADAQEGKETMSWLTTVPLYPSWQPVVEAAAQMEQRKVADYVRQLVIKDLVAKGLMQDPRENIPTPLRGAG